jgi:hypothetical protein
MTTEYCSLVVGLKLTSIIRKLEKLIVIYLRLNMKANNTRSHTVNILF